MRARQNADARASVALMGWPFPEESGAASFGHIIAWWAIHKLGGRTFPLALPTSAHLVWLFSMRGLRAANEHRDPFR